MIVAAGVAVAAGAALQSATGFGFALVCAPILVATLGAQAGITAALILGLLVNALTLTTERRPSAVLAGEAARLTAWSLPGIALGAAALAHAPEEVIQVGVAIAVLVALATRVRARPRPTGGPPRPWSAALAGTSAGALSTATSLSGPPLVLHLLHRRTSPAQIRDTLAAVFLPLGVLSVAALLVAGALRLDAALPALAVSVAVGHLAGRRAFAALDAAAHERAILAVLALTAAGALLAGAA